MSNRRSHSDNALPSREIKKQGRISSMEDTVHEPKIKREAEASPSVLHAVPPASPPAVLPDHLDDNPTKASSDADTRPQLIPCVECAERLFSESPDGTLVGPLQCIYPDDDTACDECIRLDLPCNFLILPARATAARIQVMKPGKEAREASQDFADRLRATWAIYDETNGVVRELRDINRNVFRVVNELRENASKLPLDPGYLKDYWDAWYRAGDTEDEEAGEDVEDAAGLS
ncbi:hypothetical protein BJX66DRAFT_335671 [Aspergillus keveii]|uniref:RING finger domain protein n=1 Tax=Aspergillus keveii TaxID=714993 RepID=A0ABR4GCG1_9EURO